MYHGMKKAVKFMGLLAVVVAMALSLTACGGVAGKYVCDAEVMGTKATMTIELKNDDTYVISVSSSAGDVSSDQEVSKGTYKIDGDKITFTDESGAENEATYKKGKSITVSEEGVTMTYKKK